MDSKYLLGLFSFALLSACTNVGGGLGRENDGLIGEKVGAVTPMSSRTSADRTEIAMFDKTTRLIHQFDLSRSSVVRTLEVDRPEEIHSLLFDEASSLIVDLSEGHIVLFDRAGHKTVDPLQMTDQARSAAFNAALGLLVVYDKMGSVGLIRFDSNGSVLSTWSGGSVIANDVSLLAGDLLSDGTLVLALGDGSLAKVNVMTALANRDWGTVPTVTTTLTGINWVSPIRGYTDRVLVTTASKVAIVMLNDGSILPSYDLVRGDSIAMKVKTPDAHIVLQTSSQVTAVYTDGTTLRSRSANIVTPLVTNSRLSVADDTWTLIDASKEISWSYNATEVEPSARELLRYRLHDLNPLRKMKLPDQAQLDISDEYVFALYPDELGYAERLTIMHEGEVSKIAKFNLGYIRR